MGRRRKNRKRKHRRKEKEEEKILCGGNDIARYDRSVCITRQERSPRQCCGCQRYGG